MSTSLLIFPHQLFEHHPGVAHSPDECALLEDNLFFGDPHHPARFHQQKLWLHRASMKAYGERLSGVGLAVRYVDHCDPGGALASYLESFHDRGGQSVLVAEPHDDLLTRRLMRITHRLGLSVEVLETPMFFNSQAENMEYRRSKKRWFMADFYAHQRRSLGVLMDGDTPVGGQWSFDHENRKKVTKALHTKVPSLPSVHPSALDLDAQTHVKHRYTHHPGAVDQLIYPTTHDQAREWLEVFVRERFQLFGPYEDAILQGENTLWHSVLTPMLNIGLLTPRQVLTAVLEGASEFDVPINYLEGFVRQVIGWREFVRATYEDLGVPMRTTNHWGHRRPLSKKFYTANTGVEPVDDVISRVLETGYCHHIERLMVLGGFMFLCEIDPDDIYRWFMEMFIDAYDWVMVPNVYGMSQHADGGLITTKPYFSGSSYIRKMSNYRSGPWAEAWDGLYWRWIYLHMDELARNPRWAMMCAMARKMDPDKMARHLSVANAFLDTL